MTGIGAVVLSVTKGLRSRGDQVEWVVPDALGDVFLRPPDGVQVREVRVTRWPYGRDLMLALGTFSEILRRTGVGMVHAHQPHLQTLASILAARLRDVSVVVTLHGRLPRPTTWLRRTILEWTERATLAWADTVVTVSEDAARIFGEASCRVIHNGISANPEEPNSNMRRNVRTAWRCEDAFTLLYAGRFSKLKGVFDLVDAFDRVRNIQRGAVLVMIGNGLPEEEQELRQRIRSIALDPDVRLYGSTPDYRKLLCGADLYVFPSYIEGLPLSLLEAMAEGLPVVATDVGGIPEIVRDGVEGRLVPPGDISALERAIMWMGSHDEDRRAMGERARARVLSEFSEDAMVDRYVELYEEGPGPPSKP